MNWLHLLLACLLLLAAWRLWRYRRWRKDIHAAINALAAGERPLLPEHRFAPEVVSGLRRLVETLESQDRRAAEEAFNFRAILSSMVEGVMVVDERRVIRMVNDSFLQLFDLEENPSGQSILAALREASIEEIARATIESREPQSREVSVLHRGQAQQDFFAVNAVPIEDRDGTPNGAVVVFHETTQVRQLEMVRREFVSNVSHELRTPLSIFHGYLENLIDAPELAGEERAEIFSIMKKHSLRLNALLEDLLTLARLESRRAQLDPVEIRVESFVEQFAADWQLRLAEKQLSLEVKVQADLRLTADLLRLEQVLNNLLENAAKYTPAGGRITINAEQEGSEVLLEVCDNGPGIPASDLPHIFERFYRVEKGRSREGGGTGLGLSIVKHIMALHGGSAEAESAFGKGTTIRVRFPVEPMEAQLGE